MRILKKKKLYLLLGYLKDVVDSVNETISILNGNYGVNRNLDKNLGGYIQVRESLEELKSLKEGRLKDLV